MVINETPNEDLSQGTFSIPNLEAVYENVIDASFSSFGRSIIIHLPPVMTEPSGTQPNHQAFRFNPLLMGAHRMAPVERSAGAHYEDRRVTYTAHIKHGPADIIDETPLGRIADNEVQTTTVIGSEKHIRDAIAVTIDGRRYKLSRGPRPIGLGQARYLITVWEEINEAELGAK